MSITIPEPWLMLLVFVVFLTTMFLLNTWLFKPLIGFMDEREASLRKDLESVASDDSEAQEIQRKIQAIFTDAKAQAGKIIEQATLEAKAEYDTKIAKKQEELMAKMEEFRVALEQQKVQVKDELIADLGTFESVLRAKVQQI